jgi:hypothetical protein
MWIMSRFSDYEDKNTLLIKTSPNWSHSRTRAETVFEKKTFLSLSEGFHDILPRLAYFDGVWAPVYFDNINLG